MQIIFFSLILTLCIGKSCNRSRCHCYLCATSRCSKSYYWSYWGWNATHSMYHRRSSTTWHGKGEATSTKTVQVSSCWTQLSRCHCSRTGNHTSLEKLMCAEKNVSCIIFSVIFILMQGLKNEWLSAHSPSHLC